MGFHLICLLHVLLKCFIQYYVNSSPALVLHKYVSESGHHWFRKWLVAYSAPSHYLNQWWVIVNWTLRNKLQWNFNQNIKLFIYEMHQKISSTKWRPFCPGRDELNWTLLLQTQLYHPCFGWLRLILFLHVILEMSSQVNVNKTFN